MLLNDFSVRFQYSEGLYTTCSIFTKEGVLLSSGEAECSKKDMFSKDTGRKVSLKRALETGPFTKEQRAAVWEDYRLSRPVPRWGKRE